MEGLDRREIALGVVRLLAGLAALVVVVSVLGWELRAPLEQFGDWFVGRFGVLGMAAGAFLADGAHFPLPPQFYLLTGVAAGIGAGPALASVVVGSALGGLVAFATARRAATWPWLERRFATTRALVSALIDRRGTRGLVIAGLIPVSYFVLCVLGGMMRLRYRDYGVLALMRVPRIVVSYLVIAAAWGDALGG